MFRAILNAVPLPALLVGAVVVSLGIVLGPVWLVRRLVPATGEGFTAFRTVEPRSPSATSFYDDAVRQLNTALGARRDRLESATGGLPQDIVILLLFSSVVIVGYAVLVGSRHFWFHALDPAAIAMVVAVSLVVLMDLSFPFSGDVAISPHSFESGSLSQFFYGP